MAVFPVFPVSMPISPSYMLFLSSVVVDMIADISTHVSLAYPPVPPDSSYCLSPALNVAPLNVAPNPSDAPPTWSSPCLQGLSSGWQQRWTVVALCFVAFVLCNLDRVNMSIAILPMSEQYGWSSATMGLVQSSFFW